MNIVCLGDSITHAAGYAEGDRWPVVLQCKLQAWRPGGFSVYTRAAGGDTTAQGLERLQEVLSLMPGVVLVQFGFKDANCRPFQDKPRVSLAEFAANLLSIGRLVRARKGRAVYLLNHPVGSGAGPQGDGRDYPRRVVQYNRAARGVAAQLRARCIDLPALLRARRISPKVFLRDCVHLTPEGNRIYGELVFEQLRRVLGSD